jgi:hypothetical protein
MSGGTVTPPRDGDRTGDDQLVARVIPLRRRDTSGVGLAAASAPTPEYTLLEEPGEPTPMLSSHDMWGEPAYQLCTPAPAGAADAASDPPLPRLAPPRVLAVASVLAVLAAVAVIASLAGPRARPHAARGPAPPTSIKGAHAPAVNPAAVPPRSSGTTSPAAARARHASEQAARLERARALARARASSPAASVAPTTPAGGAAPSSNAPAAPADASSSRGASDATSPRPVARAPSVTDPNRCVPGDLTC